MFDETYGSFEAETFEWDVSRGGHANYWQDIQPIALHRCTEEDYTRFYPGRKDQAGAIKAVKHNLLCLDQSAKSMFGHFDATHARNI